MFCTKNDHMDKIFCQPFRVYIEHFIYVYFEYDNTIELKMNNVTIILSDGGEMTHLSPLIILQIQRSVVSIKVRRYEWLKKKIVPHPRIDWLSKEKKSASLYSYFSKDWTETSGKLGNATQLGAFKNGMSFSPQPLFFWVFFSEW